MTAVQLRRAWAIASKDMRIYYLKAPMISWGLMFPLVMILAFSLRNPGDMRSISPGLIGLTILFAGTSMEAVVISFEKRIGALERLLMAPLSPMSILVGKGMSGALFGLGTGLLVWIATSLAWGFAFDARVLLVLLLSSIIFALMGLIISLLMREVFDAMTMANFFRFPMLFLSGVFLPVAEMAWPLRLVAAVLPLTYTVDALRHLVLRGAGASYPLWTSLLVLAAFAVVLYVIALRLLVRRLEDLL